MKQAPGGLGTPVPAVLLGAIPQPPCLHFAEGPPRTPIRPIFGGLHQKTCLKWEILQEVASRLDDVI